MLLDNLLNLKRLGSSKRRLSKLRLPSLHLQLVMRMTKSKSNRVTLIAKYKASRPSVAKQG